MLHGSGTVDAFDVPTGLEDDIIDPAVESAFAEIDERALACRDAYPFRVEQNTVEGRSDARDDVYTFLLLLSYFGKGCGPRRSFPERLFEAICAQAASSYLGGTTSLASSFVFGFPRRVGPAGFRKALDKLCRLMGEGQGARDRPRSQQQKDAKLDIVVWKDFDDGLPGKLIGFGQCATGENWPSKRTELIPDTWCHYWMKDPPLVPIQRLFFVPHRIDRDDWDLTNMEAGITFDRCRIARHASGLDAQSRKQAKDWSAVVLSRLADG